MDDTGDTSNQYPCNWGMMLKIGIDSRYRVKALPEDPRLAIQTIFKKAVSLRKSSGMQKYTRGVKMGPEFWS